MALGSLRDEVGRLVDTESDDRMEQLDGLATRLQQALRAGWKAGGGPAFAAKDFLHGAWLGHSLHPALSDVPIGAWTLGVLFDAIGWRKGAERAFAVGVLSALPTALAGLADWGETEGKPRRVGMIHALLNSCALGGFVGSLAARRSGHTFFGVTLSTSAYALAATSAWLGGKLVYEHGVGVSRNAWEPEPTTGFKVAARAADLKEGKPLRGEIELDGQTVPLVIGMQDGEVFALSGTCGHWGGPLWEGKLATTPDGLPCVTCPWHGSSFSLVDGRVLQGPSSVKQPSFEARLRAGNVEVRRARALRV